MNSLKLKGLRVEKGFSQSDMACVIEKTVDSYAKKERGKVMFTPSEICALANTLKMDFQTFNFIFFENKLPFGNVR